MSSLNKVEVVIGGEIITLVSGEHEDYMQRLARYIDRKLNEIKSMKTNASINERTRTLFIALNVADDYFRTTEQLRQLEATHARYITEMGRMQEENYLLTEKLRDLQNQLNESRAELEAYIENFDEPQHKDVANGMSNPYTDTGNVVNLHRVANGNR